MRYFAYHTRDAELSLDLSAETFARAFAKREKFRGTSAEEAVGWLWVIAGNLKSDYNRQEATRSATLRRFGLMRPPATQGELERIIEQATLDEGREELWDAFAELSDKQQEMIRMHVLEERSYREIAQLLEISEDTARQRLSEGLRRLAGNAAVRRLSGDEA